MAQIVPILIACQMAASLAVAVSSFLTERGGSQLVAAVLFGLSAVGLLGAVTALSL